MRYIEIGSLCLLFCGCGGSQPPAEAPSGAALETPQTDVAVAPLEKAPDSGKVDRIGAADGSLVPDGTNDLAFVSEVDGPVTSAFLVSVDEKGAPTRQYQADTLVGQTESPKELGAKPGSGTSGLGIFEGDKVLNAPDGSLGEIGPGKHRLLLYVAPSPALQAGMRVRVYFQRPDRSLISGGTVTN